MKSLFEAAAFLLNMSACAAAMLPAAALARPPIRSRAARSIDDVRHYESFGLHRYGSLGADAAMDWIAQRLRAAGLAVEEQKFAMERQYFLDAATLTADGRTVSVLPQWWIPEDKASFDSPRRSHRRAMRQENSRGCIFPTTRALI